MSNTVDHQNRGTLFLPLPSGIPPPPPPPAVHLAGDFCPPSPPSTSTSSTDARAAAALRIHSLAEKRRRERINTHLATLRRMIPNSNKMDKASLLARVIDEVRDLDRNAASTADTSAIPSEIDQVIVECENARSSKFSTFVDEEVEIKATLCCDERPDLFADLLKAFHSLKLTAIRAELTSLGGRSQNTFTLCVKNVEGKNICLNSLLESLRKVLAKVVSSGDFCS